jgi:hypothetical protein
MVQVLHLSNGDTLNPKLGDPSNRISRWVGEGISNDELVGRLYRVALARLPTEAETKELLTVIAEYGDDRRQAIEDAFWSVLTSSEFTFNH